MYILLVIVLVYNIVNLHDIDTLNEIREAYRFSAG